jgi:hypothetical protein
MANANLQRASRLQNPPQGYRALLRKLLAANSAEFDDSTVHFDADTPESIRHLVDAEKACDGVPMNSLAVLSVHRGRHVAQIFNSIVRRVSVYVVEVLSRPLSIHMQPRKSMSKEGSVIEADDDVSIFSEVARSVARFAVPLAGNPPGEHSRVQVVIEKFAQTLRGNIGLSHETLQSLIGQRPARVSARCGLRYCGAIHG